MIRHFVLLASIVAAIGSFWLVQRPAPISITRLDGVPALLDLGTHRQAEVIPVEFTVKNTGNTPIEFVGVFAECSCVRAVCYQATLAPGAKAKVRTNWKTAGSGKTQIGLRVGYRNQQPSDVGSARYLSLRGHAQITPDYTIEPPVLTFVTGHSEVKRAKLVPGIMRDGKIIRVESHCPYLEARYDSGTKEIVVVFDAARCHEGSRSEIVTIETNSDRDPVFKLRVAIEEPPRSSSPSP